MANWSSLKIYHPLEDFDEKDQRYFKQYYEAEKEAKKARPEVGWVGFSYDNFIADYIGIPKPENSEERRIKTWAFFMLHPLDKTLLVYPYGRDLHVPLGRIITDFDKEGRNSIPDTWRVACMTGDVDAGCNTEGEAYSCGATITLPILDAVKNIERYLYAVYRLPVSENLGKWAKFSQFCGEVYQLGRWITLHSLLSKSPKRCLVELDWGEVAYFYISDKGIKQVADNSPYLSEIKNLEAVTNEKQALKLINNYYQIEGQVNLIKDVRLLYDLKPKKKK